MEHYQLDGNSLTMPLQFGNQDNHHKLHHHHSNIHGTTSFLKTCFNFLNAFSGVGILSISYALASGGWLSLILLFIITISTFYTGILIKKCLEIDPHIRSYPDIGYHAFGIKGRIAISIIINLELYLIATGFFIIEGDNLYNLFPCQGFEIGDIIVSAKQIFVVIVGIIVFPTILLDNMSVLSYISASGVLASVMILGSVFWAGAFDGIGFEEKGKLINWSGIPTAVSLYTFGYCAHSLFPTLYSSMTNQRQFSNVLLLGYLFCTAIYVLMAVLGYLMFGSNVESQITLNLPTQKISSKVAIYVTLLNPLPRYAIMVTPIVNSIEKQVQFYYNGRASSIVIRTGLVFSSVVVALSFPFFGDLMSLVGAVLCATSSILLPCLCYLKIFGSYRRLGFEFVIIMGIMLMGVIVLVVGTYSSLVQIIVKQ